MDAAVVPLLLLAVAVLLRPRLRPLPVPRPRQLCATASSPPPQHPPSRCAARSASTTALESWTTSCAPISPTTSRADTSVTATSLSVPYHLSVKEHIVYFLTDMEHIVLF
ncbi:hypothetical protein GQ55_5G017100 [Panicum hallii var. hallii]|uniref:Uncharacterized protein n=1 Tax=Panicum hallii var. hallii TaxID=1504633 RepID=A0A2T7DBK6_9POAL|nr:hypothetical protein GQ55_5G017100 [Panicum hallii var. hallii]